jgi:hypothetical protein
MQPTHAQVLLVFCNELSNAIGVRFERSAAAPSPSRRAHDNIAVLYDSANARIRDLPIGKVDNQLTAEEAERAAKNLQTRKTRAQTRWFVWYTLVCNAQLLTTRKQRIRRLAMVACGVWTV